MILAIDPGTTESGWCLLKDDGLPFQSGVLSNEDMLDVVWGGHHTKDTVLAIEMIASYGMPVGREVFETCVWIGRFKQAWPNPGSVRLVYRKDAKLHLCGSPRAKDANVWQALKDRLGEPGTKKNPGPLYGVQSHARAALAVAVYTYDQMKRETL
jgi:hypothetical protein